MIGERMRHCVVLTFNEAVQLTSRREPRFVFNTGAEQGVNWVRMNGMRGRITVDGRVVTVDPPLVVCRPGGRSIRDRTSPIDPRRTGHRT